MRAFAFGLLFLSLFFILTGCQGFLDDYNYNPVGAIGSSSDR